MIFRCVFQLLGYAWAEDKEHCEEYGRMLQADPAKVSFKAKKRGLPQVGFIMPSIGLFSTCFFGHLLSGQNLSSLSDLFSRLR